MISPFITDTINSLVSSPECTPAPIPLPATAKTLRSSAAAQTQLPTPPASPASGSNFPSTHPANSNSQSSTAIRESVDRPTATPFPRPPCHAPRLSIQRRLSSSLKHSHPPITAPWLESRSFATNDVPPSSPSSSEDADDDDDGAIFFTTTAFSSKATTPLHRSTFPSSVSLKLGYLDLQRKVASSYTFLADSSSSPSCTGGGDLARRRFATKRASLFNSPTRPTVSTNLPPLFLSHLPSLDDQADAEPDEESYTTPFESPRLGGSWEINSPLSFAFSRPPSPTFGAVGSGGGKEEVDREEIGSEMVEEKEEKEEEKARSWREFLEFSREIC